MEEIVTCADVYWANSGCCVEPPCGQLNPTSDLMCDCDIVTIYATTKGIHIRA